MAAILPNGVVDKLPGVELTGELHDSLAPVLCLHDRRLGCVAALAIEGMLAARSPVVTRITRGVAWRPGDIGPMPNSLYRTLECMPRVFVLVLSATLFVYHIQPTWSPSMQL